MNTLIKIFVTGFITTLVVSACTASYHATGRKGGFGITKLAEHTYEVREEASDATSPDKLSQFILRHCAQITLEHGKRYFLLSSLSQSASEWKYGGTSYGQAIIKILHGKEKTQDVVLDAVTIVKQTNKIAHGKLSDKAKENFDELEKTAQQ